MELSSENEWCRLGDRIAWNELEETYSQNFPGHTGRPAFSVRMALGALIIQKRMRLSDRALVKAIAENPYYQYFIGLQKFTPKCPFTAPALVSFRKRLTADALVKFNERSALHAGASERKDGSVRKRGKCRNDDPGRDGFAFKYPFSAGFFTFERSPGKDGSHD